MSRDQHSTEKRKRTAIRRQRTRSPSVSLAKEQRSRRSGRRGRAPNGARQYHYTTSGALPRLTLRALELNASRAAALFLAGVMMALLVWFFLDERFYVYTAEVRGNSLVTAGEVYQAGGLHTMSIFYIDHQKVAQNIEHGLPGVTQVRVRCRLPARVSIDVREEDVRYVWRLADTDFLADGAGRILKVDDGAHAGLVVIQDLDNQPVRPGDQVDSMAFNVVGRLHSLLPDVQVFEYSKAHGVSLSDARGWRVYFGDDQRLAEKVATLKALLLKLEQEHKSAKVIDLRFAESPYYQ
jgi:cell division septal protein FtsQ